MFEDYGETRFRRRGELSVAGPSDLLVSRKSPAVYDLDGRLADEALAERRVGQAGRFPIPAQSPAQEIVSVCEEEVVWGGFMSFHYGHFLIETASRLWPVLPSGPLEGLPVVFTTPIDVPLVREWVEAVGVHTILLPEEGAVRFKRMYVPQPAWELHRWIAPEVRDIHLHIRRGLDAPPVPCRDAVWLSRQGLPGPRNKPHDEALLEWLLRDRVMSVRLETMPLAEQVATVEASRVVAGVMGSAFHTLLMARKQPECFYVCPSRFQSAYAAQDRLLETNAVFAQALVTVPLGDDGRAGLPAAHRIAIPETLRALNATVLPELLDDPMLAMCAYPERSWSRPGHETADELEVALISALVDPVSVEVRTELAARFEERGLALCADEQHKLVRQLR